MTTFIAPPRWQTDPAAVTHIGVLCRGDLYLYNPAGELVQTVDGGRSLDDMIRLAVEARCGALWLLPGRGEACPYDWPLSANALLRGDPPGYSVHELSGSNGQLVGLICQGHLRGQRIPMGVYPAWLDHWALAGYLDTLPADPEPRATAWAQVLADVARALGMQLRFSPSYTGLQMLRQELAAHHYPIPAMSEPWRDQVRQHAPSYYQWVQPIPETGGGAWIYKYDRNSSFLASAGEVPVGDPIPTSIYVRGCPGVYRVAAPWPALGYHAWGMPGPFRVGAGAGTYPESFAAPVWVWEPHLRIAERLGYALQIHGGYYWPRAQRHDLFRGWRDRLWAARTRATSTMARALIKRVGVAAIGRLAQRQGHAVMQLAEASRAGYRIRSQEVDMRGQLTGMGEVLADLGRTDLVQPHWWATIITNATERLQTAMYEHRAYGVVAGYVDAVYCLREWPKIDLEPERLGKWKLERRTWIDSEQVRELNELAADPIRAGAYAWAARLAQLHREAARAAGQDDEESEAIPGGYEEADEA